MKVCCIGYITKDTIVMPENRVEIPGGTAWYFAKAIKQLSTDNFQLITSVEEDQMPRIEELRQDGIEVISLPTRQSVCFENIYSNSTDNRRQRVTALPDPFNSDILLAVSADIVHLGSLLHDDFSLNLIEQLAAKHQLSLDAQGFLRKVLENGDVVHVDWVEKREVLPYIHTLKANEEEMLVLTGISEPHEAALILTDWGVKEVVLTFGEKGSLIYSKGQFHEIPAYPTMMVVDETGCGDTYMAGYLYLRNLGASEEEAGKFAAAMCTIKLQGHGPFCGTEKVVRKIMSSYQQTNLPLQISLS